MIQWHAYIPILVKRRDISIMCVRLLLCFRSVLRHTKCDVTLCPLACSIFRNQLSHQSSSSWHQASSTPTKKRGEKGTVGRSRPREEWSYSIWLLYQHLLNALEVRSLLYSVILPILIESKGSFHIEEGQYYTKASHHVLTLQNRVISIGNGWFRQWFPFCFW